MPIFLWFYTLSMYLCLPFLLLRLKWKGSVNKLYGKRIAERLGFYVKRQTNIAHDIWIHAVSFGEVVVASPLIEQWLQQGKKVCVTTTTATGSAHVQKLFKNKVSHVYLPYELPGAIKRFLKQFNPKALIIVETELWPNLICTCAKQSLPIIIINARLSDKSQQGYGRIRFIMNKLMNKLTVVLSQSKYDGQRFIELGLPAGKLKVLGNLKFNALKPLVAQDKVMDLRQSLFDLRPIWIAASTHPGEEALILESFAKVKQVMPNLVLVIAPRHPERAEQIKEITKAKGFNYICRTDNQAMSAKDQVFILNTLGELQLFYQISTVALVGGSLVAHGGHNMLEAIHAQTPVITGKYMHNFSVLSEQLLEAKGMLMVNNIESLTKVVIELLDNAEQRTLLNKAGQAYLNAQKDVLPNYLREIENSISK